MMYKFEIEVHPIDEPEPKALPILIQKPKWRWPWRINMLAKPKFPRGKYLPPPLIPIPKVFEPIDPNAEFRSDQLARPRIRLLYENRRLFNQMGPKYLNKINKNIQKSWDAIYYYYLKRLRDREQKRKIRRLQKRKAKKLKGKDLEKIEQQRQEHYTSMSKPKTIFLPEKIVRKRVPLETLLPNLGVLAAPKERIEKPPRTLDVSEAALKYEITENMLKIYTDGVEKLKKRMYEPPPTGIVSRAALRAKCTPRIEKLAEPSISAKEARKKDEDMYDPWEISKTALKYKPSARILELAKPLERD